MQSDFHRIALVGAGIGVSQQIAEIFGEQKQAKRLTASDMARLDAAEQKRARRRQRRKDLHRPVMDHPRPEYETLYWPVMLAADRAEHMQKVAALRGTRGLVRPKVYRDILRYVEDCDRTSDFQIVTEPCGYRQDEGEYSFECAYVDQYENGGYTGDSYAGWGCIPLNAGKFLKFHYSM